MKKQDIRKKQVSQYDALSGKSLLSPKPEIDLKIALEEIVLSEMQPDKPLKEPAFLKMTLQDLAESRLDNVDLRSRNAALEGALCKCQERLAKLKGTRLPKLG